MKNPENKYGQSGYIEIVALGLLAALIVVLALPIFSDILGPQSSPSDSVTYQLSK
jgi:hypothetical protein